MIVSPAAMILAKAATVSSVGAPAGSITHTARGASSFDTMSSRPVAPTQPSPASSFTAASLRSQTTQV